MPTIQDSKIPESWLSHLIVRHASSGKASQRNTPWSQAREQMIAAVCCLTCPALACAGIVAKSLDSSGLPCLGDRKNKCLLSLIHRQGLVGVSIPTSRRLSLNVSSVETCPTRSARFRQVQRLIMQPVGSHSFGAFRTSPETHHRGPWDGRSN